MATPVRLQLSRRREFNLQALSRETNGLEAVNVARPSIYGNPFVIGQPSGHLFKDGGDPTPLIASLTREQVVKLYRELLHGFLTPEMHPHGHDWMERFRKWAQGPFPHPQMLVRGLHGKNLACFCGPTDDCHADILLELSNPEIANTPDTRSLDEAARR